MPISKSVAYLVLATLLAACSQSTKPPLSKEKVENVYLELQMVEEYVYLNYRNLPKEEILQKQAENKAEVYKYYQTDSAEFFKSLELYAKDKEDISEIFQAVQDNLDSMREISSKQKI